MTTLQSPGVSVTVVDESFYNPAAPGTVPMLFVATAQDKMNASGTGTAQGTTSANAGTVWVITSQRDLTDTFGTPYFETDAEGNPINGSEISEYGLQTAYSVLGVSSKAYVVRADVDLSSLTPSGTAPTGMASAGTYWIDTADSTFGINEWNASSGAFTVKTPWVIDDSNSSIELSNGTPIDSFGSPGDYAMVITSDNANQLFYKAAGGWTAVLNTFDSGKRLVVSPHYQYPNFTNTGTGHLNALTGSVWIKTTTPGKGANWDVKYYNGATQAWTSVTANIYSSTQAAIVALDPVHGGSSIPAGTVIIDSDFENGAASTATKANFKLRIRNSTAPTTISASSAVTTSSNSSFVIKETLASGQFHSPVTVNVNTSTSTPLGQLIASSINTNVSLVNIKATWDPVADKLTINHVLGGDFELTDTNGTLANMGFAPSPGNGTTSNLYVAPTGDSVNWLATNWGLLTYQALPYEPSTTPTDGTLWFDSTLDADIMYNEGNQWVGYRTAFPATDANGPTVAASAPTKQQDGHSALVVGDIWIDSSMPDEYGQNIYVYNGVAWDLQDVQDHTGPNGWKFADARWATTGTTYTASSIASLLTSNYTDVDAPNAQLYPTGTRLFNTRRSGNNIKKYHQNYISGSGHPDRWVTASPNDANGVGAFGRLAQRGVVTKALKALVTANQSIRDTDTLNFNLISSPGYPELIADMVAFNTDIGQTAFVVADTPFRLEPTGTALAAYGANTAKALDNGDMGLVTYDEYTAAFYPSGYTNDNYGNNIVVPPSHMMLRTIINSDNKSYLWFAPAGTRRGTVDNASSVGYINSIGEFKTVSLYQGLRDVMSTVKINPIATLPGVGIVNMGQYTRAHSASSLDRINVARLVGYLRRQLTLLSKPFLFEPNDSQTRKEIKTSIESLLLELVGQRAIYDYVVVCDSTNNTPARIDQSELYVDIAIEPVKAVEFIYIPLRLLNTGAISSGNFGSKAK
jgi:hypothetical protein